MQEQYGDRSRQPRGPRPPNRRWDDRATAGPHRRRALRVPAWLIGVALLAGAGGMLIGALTGAAVRRRAVPLAPTRVDPATQLASRWRRLGRVLEARVQAAPARHAAISLIDLQSGRELHVHPDRVFLAASLIKLPVMAATFQHWIRRPATDTRRTRDWLERMVTESDNPSTNALIRLVGGTGVVTGFCRGKGREQFRISHRIGPHRGMPPNICTAREVLAFLTAVDRRQLVSPAADEEMWQVLLRQKKRQRIPAGVPPDPLFRVGNKTGTLSNVLHDAGVIHTPIARYALCVLMDGHRSEAAGDRFCRDVSRLVFETFHAAENSP